MCIKESKVEVLKRHRANLARRHEEELADFDEAFEMVRAELAEPEKPKPKLRHGDYGTYNTEGATGNPAVYIDDAGQGCLHDTAVYGKMNDTGCSYATEPADNGEFVVLGNIFADLTALSEDVDEITVEGNQGERVVFRANDQGGLYVSIGMDSVSAKSANAIIPLGTVLKLRQMAATAARKSGKQE